MPYQVKLGSLTVMAETACEALEIFERMAEGDNAKAVSIRDLDGEPIDPAVLRRSLEGRSSR